MSTLTDYDQDRIKVKVESNADCHKNNWTFCNRIMSMGLISICPKTLLADECGQIFANTVLAL